MVAAASMADDFYVYDEANMKLVGERYHKEYTLGEKVRIKVVGADRISKTIDFRLIDEDYDETEDNVYYEEEYVPKARKLAGDKAKKIRTLSKKAKEDADNAQISEEVDRLLKKAKKSLAKSDSKKSKTKGTKKSEKNAEKKTKSTRKVYKVHKYKKSATSKAARSAQGKGRKKKR